MSSPNPLRIVVGIDGSADSQLALKWALLQGTEIGAVVEVVHCWQPETLLDIALGSRHEFSRASVCMLDGEVASATREAGMHPTVVQTSLHGRPAATLVARAAHASMLVLGAHGYTALADVIFGRIAKACLREASCPVVIVDREGAVTHGHSKRSNRQDRKGMSIEWLDLPSQAHSIG
ncbi:MAG: universal stress protein [Actinomycetota bacterium]|nr:universal stress protein [Actinomycetota bacterium]